METPEIVYLNYRLNKSATFEDPDGNLFVEGILTSADLDWDEQIIDYDFSKKATQEWFDNYGNIRQMHNSQLVPAGKAVDITFNDDAKTVTIKAQILEEQSKILVKAGVYAAYSIGIIKPEYNFRDPMAKNGRIIGGTVMEGSLVDFPANPVCRFVIAKKMDNGKIGLVNKLFADNKELKTKGLKQTVDAIEALYKIKGIDSNKEILKDGEKMETSPLEQLVAANEVMNEGTDEIPAVEKTDETEAVTTPDVAKTEPEAPALEPEVGKADEVDIELPGEEDQHNMALNAARDALMALLSQEAQEGDIDGVQQLAYIINELDYFITCEALEGAGLEDLDVMFWNQLAELAKSGKAVKEWAPENTEALKKYKSLVEKSKEPEVKEDVIPGEVKLADAEVTKDELTTEERDALPDSDFAYIDSDGDRYLPINDADHVRAAMGGDGFTKQEFEDDDAKKSAAKAIMAAAKKFDIDVDEDSAVAEAAKVMDAEVGKTTEEPTATEPELGKAAGDTDDGTDNDEGDDSDDDEGDEDEDSDDPGPSRKFYTAKAESDHNEAVKGLHDAVCKLATIGMCATADETKTIETEVNKALDAKSAELIKAHAEEVETLVKAHEEKLAEITKENELLKEENVKLGSMANPANAAVRGVGVATKTRTLSTEELQEIEFYSYLAKNEPDFDRRQKAAKALDELQKKLKS